VRCTSACKEHWWKGCCGAGPRGIVLVVRVRCGVWSILGERVLTRWFDMWVYSCKCVYVIFVCICCIYVCVCGWACVCVCVCVCVCERERESVYVCVCVCFVFFLLFVCV